MEKQGWEFEKKWAYNERMCNLLKKLAIRSFGHFWCATWAIRSWSLIFGERPEQFAYIAQFWWATWAICSHRSLKRENERIARFCKRKSDLGESLTVAHLSWVTWGICSQSLIVLSDLSKLLTVTHLIWAIWATERMSDKPMSKFSTLWRSVHLYQFLVVFFFFFLKG